MARESTELGRNHSDESMKTIASGGLLLNALGTFGMAQASYL